MSFFTRRSYIRAVSYMLAIFGILTAFAIINTNEKREYKTKLEASYQQSLGELSGCLDTVNTDLTKTLYSNSSKELYALSRDLFAQCQSAKNAVSRLPVSQMELANVYKFLSQASDYAQFIGNEVSEGKSITPAQHKTLFTLLEYAEKFSNSADDMVKKSQAGALITDGAVKSDTKISTGALDVDFSNGAKTFESFPTLLYDGPFADQVLNKKSKLLKAAQEKTKDECKAIAAKAIGVNKNRVTFAESDKSSIPCYTFRCGRYTISITRQGGYVKSILYSGAVTSAAITEQNAQNIAQQYLKSIGYGSMSANYYSVQDNICTVNFVYKQGDMLCYSDLIKCGVALDSGKIVSLDSATYITNHIPRSKFSPAISSKSAQKKLSPYLTVNDVSKCVIPKESGKDVQCYEFNCTSSDTGEDALVYINAKTGAEEDIMLLLYTDGGTLVK
ncbi:MAG: germination protein YpeB [Eubacterium sp.]|nr:germination protein YpeB [Eubacterium sp.]